MVDRTWWTWQNQVPPAERHFQIAGTRTFRNIPPSDPATIEDIIDLGWVQPLKGAVTKGIKWHISTVAGPYCYVYM